MADLSRSAEAAIDRLAHARPAPVRTLSAEQLRTMAADVERHQRAIARHKAALVTLGEEIADRIVEASGAEKAASALQQWIEGLR